jgi:putative toxin-antitoxin system antitoxin component (TIGR02293 family)
MRMTHALKGSTASEAGLGHIKKTRVRADDLKTRSDRDFLEQIEAIRHGISVEAFEETAEKVGLSKSELAQKLGLSPRTISSRKSLLTREESEKTIRVQDILTEAAEVFGSEAEAQEWLTSPAYGLNNQKPIDLLDTDLGAGRVRGLLSAIKYGNVW